MSMTRTPHHIRLVFDRDKESLDDATFAPPQSNLPIAHKLNSTRKTCQLSFDFESEHTIYVMNISRFDPQGIWHFIDETNITCIFDIRFVPRLDVIAKSRYEAFSLFSSRNISYVDFFGRIKSSIHRNQYHHPNIWSEYFVDLFNQFKGRVFGLVIFDNDSLLVNATEELNVRFESQENKSPNIIVLENAEIPKEA